MAKAKMLKVEQTLERVGRLLQEIHGENPIPRDEIVRRVAEECDCAPGSVIPSDYCYDRINDGVRPAEHVPMFERVGRGLYKFLGRNHPYNGRMRHYPKGGDTDGRLVGTWVSGRFTPAGGSR